MGTHAKPKSGDTYLDIGPQHHHQKDTEDNQECNCNVTRKSQRHFLHAVFSTPKGDSLPNTRFPIASGSRLSIGKQNLPM